jgi:uncharacterized protein (DUF433 family)
MIMINSEVYPHISSDPLICGGAPCIAGTRIPVRIIGSYVQMGISPEVLLQEYYPWLTKAEVFSALAYYYDHLIEVEAIDTLETA